MSTAAARVIRPTTDGDVMYREEMLARTQHLTRLEEAARLRRGHYLVLARRASRRAERAALQARLVLARPL